MVTTTASFSKNSSIWLGMASLFIYNIRTNSPSLLSMRYKYRYAPITDTDVHGPNRRTLKNQLDVSHRC